MQWFLGVPGCDVDELVGVDRCRGRASGSTPRSIAKNASSPSVSRRACRRQRAALVEPVVEHQLRARVARPRGPAASAAQPVASAGARSSSADGPPDPLRPQPLGVAGEPLVQPDVAPPADGQAVAEPLVRQLVGDEPLGAAPPVHVVARRTPTAPAPRAGSPGRRRSPRPCSPRTGTARTARSNSAIISGWRPKSCGTPRRSRGGTAACCGTGRGAGSIDRS